MRKIYKPAVIVTAVMLSLTACGGKEEPVVSETATEEPAVSEMAIEEPEESREDTTPSENESPTGEESPEDIESEADTTQEEEIAENQSESDLGYEIIPMDDTTMYCTGNSANIRKGPSTDYDKVGSLAYAQEVTINGKVEADGDKLWYVLKTSDGSIQMVSGSLLSTTKPQSQQSTGGDSGTGNTGTTQQSGGESAQPSGGGSESQGRAWLESMFGPGSDGAGGGAVGDFSQDWSGITVQ